MPVAARFGGEATAAAAGVSGAAGGSGADSLEALACGSPMDLRGFLTSLDNGAVAAAGSSGSQEGGGEAFRFRFGAGGLFLGGELRRASVCWALIELIAASVLIELIAASAYSFCSSSND